MNFKINQKHIVKLRFLLLPVLILILFACATVPTKTYDETVSQWKSYKDVAKWMSWHFSYDMKRLKEGIEKHTYDNPMPVRPPEETFKLRSGVCFDGARFVKETLNRIDPSYEAEIVFLDLEGVVDHYQCSFKKDGKLYVMDYSTSVRNWIGVHGPFNSLEEYKKFLERLSPRGQKVLSVTFGWPEWKKKVVK